MPEGAADPTEPTSGQSALRSLNTVGVTGGDGNEVKVPYFVRLFLPPLSTLVSSFKHTDSRWVLARTDGLLWCAVLLLLHCGKNVHQSGGRGQRMAVSEVLKDGDESREVERGGRYNKAGGENCYYCTY
jgi:hypothetical protein